MESSRNAGRTEIRSVRLGSEYGSAGVGMLLELEERLTAEIRRARSGVVIDCRDVNYVGCGFVDALLRCHVRAKKLNRRIALCRVGHLLGRILSASQLESVWCVFETKQEAADCVRLRAKRWSAGGTREPAEGPSRPLGGAGLPAFRVWLRQWPAACCIRVDGRENTQWLFARLGESVGTANCEPIGGESPVGCWSFRVAYGTTMNGSALHALLAGIPEVVLMRQPA